MTDNSDEEIEYVYDSDLTKQLSSIENKLAQLTNSFYISIALSIISHSLPYILNKPKKIT